MWVTYPIIYLCQVLQYITINALLIVQEYMFNKHLLHIQLVMGHPVWFLRYHLTTTGNATVKDLGFS